MGKKDKKPQSKPRGPPTGPPGKPKGNPRGPPKGPPKKGTVPAVKPVPKTSGQPPKPHAAPQKPAPPSVPAETPDVAQQPVTQNTPLDVPVPTTQPSQPPGEQPSDAPVPDQSTEPAKEPQQPPQAQDVVEPAIDAGDPVEGPEPVEQPGEDTPPDGSAPVPVREPTPEPTPVPPSLLSEVDVHLHSVLADLSFFLATGLVGARTRFVEKMKANKVSGADLLALEAREFSNGLREVDEYGLSVLRLARVATSTSLPHLLEVLYHLLPDRTLEASFGSPANPSFGLPALIAQVEQMQGGRRAKIPGSTTQEFCSGLTSLAVLDVVSTILTSSSPPELTADASGDLCNVCFALALAAYNSKARKKKSPLSIRCDELAVDQIRLILSQVPIAVVSGRFREQLDAASSARKEDSERIEAVCSCVHYCHADTDFVRYLFDVLQRLKKPEGQIAMMDLLDAVIVRNAQVEIPEQLFGIAEALSKNKEMKSSALRLIFTVVVRIPALYQAQIGGLLQQRVFKQISKPHKTLHCFQCVRRLLSEGDVNQGWYVEEHGEVLPQPRNIDVDTVASILSSLYPSKKIFDNYHLLIDDSAAVLDRCYAIKAKATEGKILECLHHKSVAVRAAAVTALGTIYRRKAESVDGFVREHQNAICDAMQTSIDVIGPDAIGFAPAGDLKPWTQRGSRVFLRYKAAFDAGEDPDAKSEEQPVDTPVIVDDTITAQPSKSELKGSLKGQVKSSLLRRDPSKLTHLRLFEGGLPLVPLLASNGLSVLNFLLHVDPEVAAEVEDTYEDVCGTGQQQAEAIIWDFLELLPHVDLTQLPVVLSHLLHALDICLEAKYNFSETLCSQWEAKAIGFLCVGDVAVRRQVVAVLQGILHVGGSFWGSVTQEQVDSVTDMFSKQSFNVKTLEHLDDTLSWAVFLGVAASKMKLVATEDKTSPLMIELPNSVVPLEEPFVIPLQLGSVTTPAACEGLVGGLFNTLYNSADFDPSLAVGLSVLSPANVAAVVPILENFKPVFTGKEARRVESLHGIVEQKKDLLRLVLGVVSGTAVQELFEHVQESLHTYQVPIENMFVKYSRLPGLVISDITMQIMTKLLDKGNRLAKETLALLFVSQREFLKKLDLGLASQLLRVICADETRFSLLPSFVSLSPSAAVQYADEMSTFNKDLLYAMAQHLPANLKVSLIPVALSLADDIPVCVEVCDKLMGNSVFSKIASDGNMESQIGRYSILNKVSENISSFVNDDIVTKTANETVENCDLELCSYVVPSLLARAEWEEELVGHIDETVGDADSLFGVDIWCSLAFSKVDGNFEACLKHHLQKDRPISVAVICELFKKNSTATVQLLLRNFKQQRKLVVTVFTKLFDNPCDALLPAVPELLMYGLLRDNPLAPKILGWQLRFPSPPSLDEQINSLPDFCLRFEEAVGSNLLLLALKKIVANPDTSIRALAIVAALHSYLSDVDFLLRRIADVDVAADAFDMEAFISALLVTAVAISTKGCPNSAKLLHLARLGLHSSSTETFCRAVVVITNTIKHLGDPVCADLDLLPLLISGAFTNLESRTAVLGLLRQLVIVGYKQALAQSESMFHVLISLSLHIFDHLGSIDDKAILSRLRYHPTESRSSLDLMSQLMQLLLATGHCAEIAQLCTFLFARFPLIAANVGLLSVRNLQSTPEAVVHFIPLLSLVSQDRQAFMSHRVFLEFSREFIALGSSVAPEVSSPMLPTENIFSDRVKPGLTQKVWPFILGQLALGEVILPEASPISTPECVGIDDISVQMKTPAHDPAETQKLKDQVRQLEAQMTRMGNDLGKAMSEKEVLYEKIAGSSAELAESVKRAKRKDLRVGELEEVIKHHEEERERIMRESDEALKTAATQRKDDEAAIKVYMEKVETLQKQVSDAQKAMTGDDSELRHQLTEAQQTLEKERELMRESVAAAEKEAQSAKDSVSGLRATIASLQHKEAELRKELDHVRTSSSDMPSTTPKVAAKPDAVATPSKQLEEENLRLKMTVEELTGKLQVLESQSPSKIAETKDRYDQLSQDWEAQKRHSKKQEALIMSLPDADFPPPSTPTDQHHKGAATIQQQWRQHQVAKAVDADEARVSRMTAPTKSPTKTIYPTMEQVLSQPRLAYFSAFVENNFDSDSLSFYLSVQQVDSEIDPVRARKRARIVVDRFVSFDSFDTVNLSKETRQDILDKVHSGDFDPYHLFDGSLQEISLMMQTYWYVSFLNSRECRQMMADVRV